MLVLKYQWYHVYDFETLIVLCLYLLVFHFHGLDRLQLNSSTAIILKAPRSALYQEFCSLNFRFFIVITHRQQFKLCATQRQQLVTGICSLLIRLVSPPFKGMIIHDHLIFIMLHNCTLVELTFSTTLLSRSSLRLHASMMSICLSVCLSVCRQNAKKAIFWKK